MSRHKRAGSHHVKIRAHKVAKTKRIRNPRPSTHERRTRRGRA